MSHRKPLAIDLFCGLGGWTEGFLSEGWDVVGFDIERHVYGDQRYPAQLVQADVLSLWGSQFAGADCIVASPPCQEFSYMAMPWSRAKQIAAALCEEVPFPEGYTGSRTVPELRALFDACFRIQREACEAAGRHIPMVVENVKGAQPWVGRAKANFGSFYFWGDVAMVGGQVVAGGLRFGQTVKAAKRRMKSRVSCAPQRFDEREPTTPEEAHALHYRLPKDDGQKVDGRKGPGGDWFKDGRQGQDACAEGLKTTGHASGANGGKGFVTGLGKGHDWRQDPTARFNSKSDSRKAASAQIAKMPFPLASYIARQFRPALPA